MDTRDRQKERRKKEKGKEREERSPTPYSDMNLEGSKEKILLNVQMVRSDLIVEFNLELDFEERISWRGAGQDSFIFFTDSVTTY